LAQRAFERCIELANDEALAMEASYRLGRVFEMTERPAAAERSYRRALGSGGIGSAAAALRLAEIVQASEGGAGNAEEQIRALYLRAIQLGSAEAALRLGQLEEQNLRDAEAESAYRKGMELGSAKSALELGRFLAERRTDLRGVGEAYLRAWTVAKGELPGAWLDLIERHSDIDGARAALAHPGGFIGDAGLRRLGKILEASGDPEGAAAVYARIRRSNDALRARRPQPPPEATPPAIAPQK